jgi:hypothetical protein
VKPAVIVLLLVARGDMQQPAMAALTRAAETVLGPQSHIVFHEQAKALGDDEAIALADQMRASMVVTVTWSSDQSRAHVHVHFAERSGWLERDVSFSPHDPPTERGRTLGFEIATMVPDMAPSQAPAPPAPALSPAKPEERPLVPVAAHPTQWAVDLNGTGAVGGDATGYGIGAGARWAFMSSVFVRAGGAVRFGRVLPADATSTTWVPAIGVGYLPEVVPSRVRIGARVDGLALFTELSREAPAEARGRWTPGVDVLAEVEVAASPVAVGLAAGAEYVWGSTNVRIGDTDAATLPRLRLLTELGLRLRF